MMTVRLASSQPPESHQTHQAGAQEPGGGGKGDGPSGPKNEVVIHDEGNSIVNGETTGRRRFADNELEIGARPGGVTEIERLCLAIKENTGAEDRSQRTEGGRSIPVESFDFADAVDMLDDLQALDDRGNVKLIGDDRPCWVGNIGTVMMVVQGENAAGNNDMPNARHTERIRRGADAPHTII